MILRDTSLTIFLILINLDLAGGWSDTPPICYEVGGSVLNVAVQVDNRRPIQCASRVIEDPFIILHSLKKSGDEINGDTVICKCFKDFLNVSDTSSSTSLLKAAILVLRIIEKSDVEYYRNLSDETENEKFSNRLVAIVGGGLEVACISDLPAGSGMGGSSIVAAVVVQSLVDLLCIKTSKNNLIDLVTQVEQVLSSGGGWQDQIGSIFGGFKIGRSLPKLPLQVSVQELPVHSSLIAAFEKRCFLIYTGKQRLAKNILINALRNCSLTPACIDQDKNYNTVSSLIHGAETGCDLLVRQNNNNIADDDCIDNLARIVDEYFQCKVQMAPGTNPDHIQNIINSVLPISEGNSLCGAGGGGYACVFLKRGNNKSDLLKTIDDYNTANKLSLTVHDVTIDIDGIATRKLDNTLYIDLKDYLLI